MERVGGVKPFGSMTVRNEAGKKIDKKVKPGELYEKWKKKSHQKVDKAETADNADIDKLFSADSSASSGPAFDEQKMVHPGEERGMRGVRAWGGSRGRQNKEGSSAERETTELSQIEEEEGVKKGIIIRDCGHTGQSNSTITHWGPRKSPNAINLAGPSKSAITLWDPRKSPSAINLRISAISRVHGRWGNLGGRLERSASLACTYNILKYFRFAKPSKSQSAPDAATAILQGKAPTFKDGANGRSWDDWYVQVRADLASVECWEHVQPLAEVIRWRTEVEAELRAEAKEVKKVAARLQRGDVEGKQQEQKQELTPTEGVKSSWQAVLDNEAMAPARGLGGHASTITVMRADLAFQRMLRFFHERPDTGKTGMMPRYLNDDDDDNGYQSLDDQPVPPPQPPPQRPQLEEEEHTVVRQRRPPSSLQLNLRGSVGPNVRRSLRFAASSSGNRSNASHRLGSPSSPANGLLAPRDINGNVSSSNIIATQRERKQTPANHPTHHVSLAHDSQAAAFFDVAAACNLEHSETDLADLQQDAYEEQTYDEPFCFFTRALRIPQKEIHQHPEVVAARRKEIEGLFKAGCFRWVPRANAYRDKIKPIHTGFVDAVKIDEATGNHKFKSRLVMFGNLMSPFSHYSPYDKSAPVCSHMVMLTVLSLTAALGFDFVVIDFTQAYSQADMIDIIYAIAPDDFEDFRDPEKPEDDILQVLKALADNIIIFTKALPAPAHRTFIDQITVPLASCMADDEDAPARLFRSDALSPTLSPYVVRARKRKGKKSKQVE
eukprot:g82152.t1